MEHSKRTTFLQKMEKSIKADNTHLLQKTLKLDRITKSTFGLSKLDFLAKELEIMKLPKNTLHFIAESGALECFKLILNQTVHDYDVNYLYKGETVLTRLVVLASQKFQGQSTLEDLKELIKQRKKIQMKNNAIVGKGLGLDQANNGNTKQNEILKSINEATSNLLPTEIATAMVKEISKVVECDFNLPREDGWRPLMLAGYLGCTDVCKILITPRTELLFSRHMHNQDSRFKTQMYNQNFLNSNNQPKIADINFYNSDGLNCVHIAAANGNSETATFLLQEEQKFLSTCEFGVDYNAKSHGKMCHGLTPLLVAAVNCQVHTAKAILELHRKKIEMDLDKVAVKLPGLDD